MTRQEMIDLIRGDQAVRAAIQDSVCGMRDNTANNVKFEISDPGLEKKVAAAIFVATYGASRSIKTKAVLMWPYAKFSNAEAIKEASSLLGDVLAALLRSVPPQEIERIVKAQDERLSSFL